MGSEEAFLLIHTMRQYRFGIVVPYFGQWPEWFQLYLKTLEKNRQLTVFFITDCSIPSVAPSNAVFKEMSFQEYSAEVSQKLSIEFYPPRAWKLCDLKPFYGVLHEDLFKGYDFFGWGDIDLIYGDVAGFLQRQADEGRDILSFHSYILSGHMCLVRNERKMRESCFRIPRWKECLESKKNCLLDEQAFTKVHYPLYGLIRKIANHLPGDNRQAYRTVALCERMSHLLYGKRGLTEYYTTPWLVNDWLWHYDNGHITTDKPSPIEIPYLHFLFFKKEEYNLYAKTFKNSFLNFRGTDHFTIGFKGIRSAGAI